MNLKDKISDYPNFPKKGILFRDFSPVLKDPSALSFIADEFAKKFHPKDIDVFAGIESRGFILASILASRYSKGMIMIRKAGKLPGKTAKLAYTIEYGKDTIEIQKDIIKVFGAEQNVEIEITSNDGKVIGNLDGIITSAGIIDQLWAIPKNTAPGTYTVNVVNPTDSAVTTFEIE